MNPEQKKKKRKTSTRVVVWKREDAEVKHKKEKFRKNTNTGLKASTCTEYLSRSSGDLARYWHSEVLSSSQYSITMRGTDTWYQSSALGTRQGPVLVPKLT
jgi:hypothetical protein